MNDPKSWANKDGSWNYGEKVENFANPVSDLDMGGYDAKEASYPQDDALSLQQMAGNNVDFSIPYPSQFHQNELHEHHGGVKICSYQLEHTPILAGTLTGHILLQVDKLGVAVWLNVQNFVFAANGACTFATIGEQEIVATAGGLNLATGGLSLVFNADPGPGIHRIIVSYESSNEPIQEPAYTGFTEHPSSEGQRLSSSFSKSVAPVSQDQNSSRYIDYLINQLSETKSKLVDAEDKLNTLEVKMYDEYERKLKNTKEYIVGKIDEFIKMRTAEDVKGKFGVEIFDEAMNDVTSDDVQDDKKAE